MRNLVFFRYFLGALGGNFGSFLMAWGAFGLILGASGSTWAHFWACLARGGFRNGKNYPRGMLFSSPESILASFWAPFWAPFRLARVPFGRGSPLMIAPITALMIAFHDSTHDSTHDKDTYDDNLPP